MKRKEWARLINNAMRPLLSDAYRRGAEEMRERCAADCESMADDYEDSQRSHPKHDYRDSAFTCRTLAGNIRALPLTDEEPDEQGESDEGRRPS